MTERWQLRAEFNVDDDADNRARVETLAEALRAALTPDFVDRASVGTVLTCGKCMSWLWERLQALEHVDRVGRSATHPQDTA